MGDIIIGCLVDPILASWMKSCEPNFWQEPSSCFLASRNEWQNSRSRCDKQNCDDAMQSGTYNYEPRLAIETAVGRIVNQNNRKNHGHASTVRSYGSLQRWLLQAATKFTGWSVRGQKTFKHEFFHVLLNHFSLSTFFRHVSGANALCRAIPIPRTNITDRDALLQLKDKISGDPFGVFSTWNDSIHFCQWHEITCGRQLSRITCLMLPSLKLVGSLSPFIGNLSFLRILDIQNNSFVGKVPPEIGNLYRLELLGLENNSFSGQIPANISGWKNLEYLGLGNNMLVGEVPIAIASMSKLAIVLIYCNNLFGNFPEFFGNLTSLVCISANSNSFVGRVPATLGRLQNLEYLYLGKNGLSGTLPSSIFISSLVEILFHQNQLEGSLPPNLGITLSNIVCLNVAENQFTGPIPALISNATKLTLLLIPGNKLSGNVPTMGKLNQLQRIIASSNQLGSGVQGDLKFLESINSTSLKVLAINGNNFGGTLPESIGNLSSQLNIMWIQANRLYGDIPSSIGNLRGLERLSIGDNEFTSTIPDTIGSLIELKTFRAYMNKLTGKIPSTIGNLTELMELILDANNFQGSIPPSIGKCQSLLGIVLSQNDLSGIIPSQLFNISSLSIFFDLSENQLSGSLPEEIGTLSNLAILDIHDNELSGKIPSSLGRCTSLLELHMQNNLFEGNIFILEFLEWSSVHKPLNNNLSGPVPMFLEKFQLQYMNLSFNDSEGEVPSKGVFQNMSVTSLEGNDKLCGGMPILDLPSCLTSEGKRGSSTSRYMIIAVTCGMVAALILLLLLMTFYWLRRKNSKASLETPSIGGFQQVSYADIVKATDGFSSSNLIGMGSFGSVYKGTLADENKIVAVKVFDLKQRGASKSFMVECEVLKNIRHRNLVKILTACSSVDFQGNEFKALVYEFIENGSLEEWLHPDLAPNGTPRHGLSFVQRLNIAFDVDCVVDYLHHQCQTAPSNILLDAQMNGHVGDFGLARIFPNTTGDLPMSQTSSIGLRGTIGYAPPEYGMESQVSKDGDVYSYGILLLEIFTGKTPTHDMFKDALNLHDYCAAALPERVADVADQPLLLCEAEGESSADALNNERKMSAFVQECLMMIFEIGVACSAELPRERMKISDAVTRLRSLKEKVDKIGFC
ncbi:LOW QUALITY PROTEIN: hypothetical protein BT93_J1135 [Corymbia citriodora subsp. variegata]|nr:LOW QUALITY PROTEIN: hypothetical protein BT93_J1135 [Corymbia citriodora subsp. variegata]